MHDSGRKESIWRPLHIFLTQQILCRLKKCGVIPERKIDITETLPDANGTNKYFKFVQVNSPSDAQLLHF